MKSGIDTSKLSDTYKKPENTLVPKPASKNQYGFVRGMLNYFSPHVHELISQACIGDEDHAQLIACFNRNPNKTLALWLEDLTLDEQYSAIYWLITEHPGLVSAEKVGELLSEPAIDTYPWSDGLFNHYLNARFNFKDKIIVECFNEFLKADFKLPGEAQKIDRIMEQFSIKYLLDNPNSLDIKDKDAGFVLSFSMIMLNTDLHNPNITKKMSLEQFSTNLRGVNAGGDFTTVFLEGIYKYIKNNKLMWDRPSEIENKVEADFAQIKPLSEKYDCYHSSSNINLLDLQNILPVCDDNINRKRRKLNTHTEEFQPAVEQPPQVPQLQDPLNPNIFKLQELQNTEIKEETFDKEENQSQHTSSNTGFSLNNMLLYGFRSIENLPNMAADAVAYAIVESENQITGSKRKKYKR